MTKSRIFGFALCAIWPANVNAQALDFPDSAVMVDRRSRETVQVKFPIGPFDDDKVPFALVGGALQSEVWKVRQPSLSTNQIAGDLREQLVVQGYQIILDCRNDDCGGYDFRYELDLVPEPVMHVDLGDFRYVTAVRETAESQQYIGLMISRTPTGGLVQVDRQVEPGFISADVVTPAQDTAQEANRPAVQGTDVETALRQDGRLSLDDLSFGTGSSELSQGQYDSLTKLAAFLKANSDQTVALVGHTDAVGSLSANVALSTRRAASVMERLATAYGVPRSQMEAEGVGYLSPRASNLTEEGRRTNRRVEVILTSTR